jgi:hypothetical protein
MKKLIRDGKVAVLVSPGFGAGWYTWNSYHPECLYDPEIAEIVLGGINREAYEKIIKIAKSKYGDDFYAGGAEQLEVEWIPIGGRFLLDEYDGSERLTREEDCPWIIAEAE